MTSRRVAVAAVNIGIFAFFTLTAGDAAQLKDQTVKAWDDYLTQETDGVQKRAEHPDGFLWVDSDPARYKQARAGVVVVEPVGKHIPMRVVSGLIHHWIGAVFIPNASVEDVLAVTRDYARYKDYYKPGVADAQPINITPSKDEFTIRFVNSSVLAKSSLEGKYTSDFIRLSDKRWYSTSVTTQMQEIRDFGRPKERRFAPGEGSGYIWRLYSTARLEERDGGVLLELEAVALSRDIPATLHFFVDPIVRRVSRESLEKSLTETVEAVHARAQAHLAQGITH